MSVFVAFSFATGILVLYLDDLTFKAELNNRLSHCEWAHSKHVGLADAIKLYVLKMIY